ncbi:MAG: cell division protein ZipA [Acidihalobacter sp.]|jgi:cell division protein ZipA
MDTLRWILLIVGILVLAGIYVVGKRGEWRKRGRGGGEHYDPRFDDEGPDVLGLSDSEEEWVDDVRPVRRSPDDEEAAAPAFIASRDDLPSARQAPSLEIDEPTEDPSHPGERPELSASPRDEELPEDDWVDDVRPVRREENVEVPAFEAHRSPAAAPEAGYVDTEPDEDGWVDDVRPIKREIPPLSEQATADEAGRSIPADLASEVGASEETDSIDENERPEDILILHVAADPAVGRFNGRELGEAFAEFDLSFGPQGIYHREAGIGAPMFSVVNRLKPGTFDPDRLDELQTPGVTLFMQLPGPDQPMVAFRAMSDCARKLAERLGGHLEDERHEAVTPQILSRYEKRVRFYASGLYRRMNEAAADGPREAQGTVAERSSADIGATPSAETYADAYDAPAEDEREHARAQSAEPQSRGMADDGGEPSIAERAGTSARKLLGRYEERMRSLVSGLSRRSQEPDDDAWDPLMHEAGDRPEGPRAGGDSPESPPAAPGRATAAEATTEHDAGGHHRSTLERAASRHKPAGRGKTHVEPEPGMPEDLLIIHIVADPAIGTFGGDHLAEAFRACELRYGTMQIYHREARSGPPMFSVVNMINPGTFDPENFSELETPGVSLFMQLPGPEQPMVAFRTMSDCARRLAEQLGGRLQDETHSTMTMQTLGHYEERVRSFIQHQARLAGGRRV